MSADSAAGRPRFDFAKLKGGWDQISKIKEVWFVYNDRGSGLTVKLEGATAEPKAASEHSVWDLYVKESGAGVCWVDGWSNVIAGI